MTPENPLILILDDEEAICVILQSELEGCGFRAVYSQDKAQGLEWLRSNHADLVITDINSPGLRGVDFLTLLREKPETRDTKVIVVSGNNSLIDAVNVLRLGALELISKPFDMVRLVESIGKALERDFTYPVPETAPVCRGRIIISAQRNARWVPFSEELMNIGYEVEIVESHDLLRERLNDAHFDLLIATDLDGTLCDGLPGLILDARAHDPHLGIIVMSGRQDPGLAVDCWKRGADDYLTLPLELVDAFRTIERVLADRKAMREEDDA